jgi:hypothetical protein
MVDIDQIVLDATIAVATREPEVVGPRTQADLDRIPVGYSYSYSNQRMGQVVGDKYTAPKLRPWWERVRSRLGWIKSDYCDPRRRF